MSSSNTDTSINQPKRIVIGWEAVIIVAIIGITAHHYLPTHFFYEPYASSKATEYGNSTHVANAPNIQNRLHAVNETGMIMQRIKSQADAYNAYTSNHGNSAQDFINFTSKTVKSALNTPQSNGKTGFEMVAQNPINAASDFSDALAKQPAKPKESPEKMEFKKNLADAIAHAERTKADIIELQY